MKLYKYVLVLLVLVSCSSVNSKDNIISVLEKAEKELGTKNKSSQITHPILYYPYEISLNFPGFIVGIEKSPKEKISKEGDIVTIKIPNAGKKLEKLRKKIGGDKKLLYISHVIENFGKQDGYGNCAHYNAYYRENEKDQPVEFCSSDKQRQINPKEAYVKSWDALGVLKKELNKKLSTSDYTHILVTVMGWNTPQEEAIRNFNSIVRNIKLASGNKKFNPLFIGLTWPSYWKSDWYQPIKGISSYPNKANDADEIGISWLGALLHESLNNLETNLPIVVIGHSFGGRMSSIATCIGPVISKNNGLIARNKIDLLISLQGAYSMNRFDKNKGSEDLYYLGCSNANRIVLTSSVNDQAMNIKNRVPMVGNDKTYKEYCKNIKNKEIDCISVSSEGEFLPNNELSKHMTYINSDDLIKYNVYLSGGGAHSDIYRKEMGKMLWNIISSKQSKIQ